MKKIAILAIIILAVGGGIVAYASESKGSSNDNSINNTIQSSDSNTNNNNNNNNGQSYNQGNGENNSNNTEVENQNSNDTNSSTIGQENTSINSDSTNKDKTTNTKESSNNVINKNTTNHLSTSKYKDMFLIMFNHGICTPISLEPTPGAKSANAWQFNPYTTGKLISQGDKWDKVMIENKIGYVPKANVVIGTLICKYALTKNSNTFIYSSQSTNSQVVKVLPKNTSVWVEYNNDGWSNVSTSNDLIGGYILTKDLKFESKS